MRAEFLKIRSMPTPMWCLIALGVCFVLGIVAVIKWGVGEGSDAADVAIGVPSVIASIIFGVWMMGVEFGQNTLRQALTADPRRSHLIVSKLAVTIFCVAGITAFLYLISIPAYELASSGHDGSTDTEAVFRAGLAALVNNVAYAIVGFAFAMITASMAGGITIALVFVFVIDSVTSIVSWTEDYAMGPALTSVTEEITGVQTEIFGETAGSMSAQDVVVVIAWLVGLVALGSLRFIRSEVK
ncbi:MAG: hypothetical protein ACSLFD_11435 [Solirubrobacterales bacterium]